MSYPSEHRRRHLSIQSKLLSYLRSDAFREGRSCREQLDELIKLGRRYGRYENERINRFRDHQGEDPEPNRDDGKPPWYADFPGWELLQTHYVQQYKDNVNKTPGSIGWNYQEFLKRCQLKRSR